MKYVDRYEPCNADCCVRLFEVCKEYVSDNVPPFKLTVTDLGLTNSPTSCTASVKSDIVYDFNGQGTITVPCEYDCNDIDGYSKTFNKQSIKRESKPEVEFNKSEKVLLQIHDEIKNNRLELTVKNSMFEDFTVTIADINGIVIDEKIFEINSQYESNYYIDLSKYKNGTYLYRIDTQGIYVKSNKFIILK